MKNIEAIIEIIPKPALPHHFLQVAIGGGDDAHIHLLGPIAPYGFELPGLQNPENLGLDRQGEFADFIQKHGAPVGHQKASVFTNGGPGKGAPFMPEEFALQQGLGQGGAIDHHEGAGARGLFRWMAWATSSLPVPVSPRSSTVASEGATISRSWKISRMRGEEPKTPEKSNTFSPGPLRQTM